MSYNVKMNLGSQEPRKEHFFMYGGNWQPSSALGSIRVRYGTQSPCRWKKPTYLVNDIEDHLKDETNEGVNEKGKKWKEALCKPPSYLNLNAEIPPFLFSTTCSISEMKD